MPTGGPFALLHSGCCVAYPFPIRAEFTDWCDEQEAWRTSAALMDLSHHMTDLTVEGSYELIDNVRNTLDRRHRSGRALGREHEALPRMTGRQGLRRRPVRTGRQAVQAQRDARRLVGLSTLCSHSGGVRFRQRPQNNTVATTQLCSGSWASAHSPAPEARHPCEIVSLCVHPLLPFRGRAHVGYLPAATGRITGLS